MVTALTVNYDFYTASYEAQVPTFCFRIFGLVISLSGKQIEGHFMLPRRENKQFWDGDDDDNDPNTQILLDVC